MKRLWELSKDLTVGPNEWPTDEEVDKAINEALKDDSPKPKRLATIVDVAPIDPFPAEEPQDDTTEKKTTNNV